MLRLAAPFVVGFLACAFTLGVHSAQPPSSPDKKGDEKGKGGRAS